MRSDQSMQLNCCYNQAKYLLMQIQLYFRKNCKIMKKNKQRRENFKNSLSLHSVKCIITKCSLEWKTTLGTFRSQNNKLRKRKIKTCLARPKNKTFGLKIAQCNNALLSLVFNLLSSQRGATDL